MAVIHILASRPLTLYVLITDHVDKDHTRSFRRLIQTMEMEQNFVIFKVKDLLRNVNNVCPRKNRVKIGQFFLTYTTGFPLTKWPGKGASELNFFGDFDAVFFMKLLY